MNKENQKRKILIGAAWPYANGSLHLGHVSALLGSDILARYFRLNGDSVLFVSGSDCHGTPIVLKAHDNGVHPSEIADKYHKEFTETLIEGLSFSYDIYTTTTTDNHHKVVQDLFADLYKKGFIYTKIEELPYCVNCSRFLPDRYIEGECPICQYDGARGDQCDSCGNLLDANQLKKPRCKICGQSPEWRETEHFFLKLTAFRDNLIEWVKESKKWRSNARNFTLELLKQGLIDRAITRDTEWGVPVPFQGYESKRIYVWFEAVCGYLSASKEWSSIQENNGKWEEFWYNNQAVHYYVHGKDNIPFHTIIWPAILLGDSKLHLPDRIVSSEYLTLEKKQFSKSRKWAVWLPDFLSKFDSETLRYYLVAGGSETADADFSWEEYALRTNSELIGNFGNYVHRVLSFVQKNFPEGVNFPEELDSLESDILQKARNTFNSAGDHLEEANFKKGLRQIFELVEEGNRYFNTAAPWKTIKTDVKKAEGDLAVAVHVVKCLAILINPFLPKSSEKIYSQIEADSFRCKWGYPIHSFTKAKNPKPLYKRIEREDIERERSLLGRG
ncbi:MAG: methionine--tRNA ligase [Patescibacteria group bacterium]